MRTLASFTLVGSLALTVACGQRPYEHDAPEIQARYAHKYVDGECTSWLVSAKTGYRYCASPPIEVDVELYKGPILATLPKEEVELLEDYDSLMARGEEVYGNVCQTCHQADGQGLEGIYPPLAGSGDYYGDAQNHSRIIVHGLVGEIVVQGVTYNGAMAPWGSLSDYDVAAVATYERHSWGNDDGIVLPADVAAIR
ncbi:MAG: cytochrome c [Myxococcota bacterium]